MVIIINNLFKKIYNSHVWDSSTTELFKNIYGSDTYQAIKDILITDNIDVRRYINDDEAVAEVVEKIDSSELQIEPLTASDSKDFNEAMRTVFSEDSDDIKDMYKIVAGDITVGYVGLSKYNDGLLGIGNFMILPQYQNKGYGTKTIRKLIDMYKNQYHWIYAYVNKANTDAIKLYNRIGHVDKCRKNADGSEYLVTFYGGPKKKTNNS